MLPLSTIGWLLLWRDRARECLASGIGWLFDLAAVVLQEIEDELVFELGELGEEPGASGAHALKPGDIDEGGRLFGVLGRAGVKLAAHLADAAHEAAASFDIHEG
jgi:hypothetical protein